MSSDSECVWDWIGRFDYRNAFTSSHHLSPFFVRGPQVNIDEFVSFTQLLQILQEIWEPIPLVVDFHFNSHCSMTEVETCRNFFTKIVIFKSGSGCDVMCVKNGGSDKLKEKKNMSEFSSVRFSSQKCECAINTVRMEGHSNRIEYWFSTVAHRTSTNPVEPYACTVSCTVALLFHPECVISLTNTFIIAQRMQIMLSEIARIWYNGIRFDHFCLTNNLVFVDSSFSCSRHLKQSTSWN